MPWNASSRVDLGGRLVRSAGLGRGRARPAAGRAGRIEAHAGEDVLERLAAGRASAAARSGPVAQRLGGPGEERVEEVAEVAGVAGRVELVADAARRPATGREARERARRPAVRRRALRLPAVAPARA